MQYVLLKNESELVNSSLDAIKSIQAEEQSIRERLQQLAAMEEHEKGRLNGMLSLISTFAGFDTSKQIELSADRTTLIGEPKMTAAVYNKIEDDVQEPVFEDDSEK